MNDGVQTICDKILAARADANCLGTREEYLLSYNSFTVRGKFPASLWGVVHIGADIGSL
jgi:hypothetical protein